jgi:CRP/FNR family transcriptional regulator
MKAYKQSCTTCRLRESNLFAALKHAELERMSSEKSVREYQRGEVVFYEDTPAFAIYCIQSGWLKLYKAGSRGEHQVIRLLGMGDLVGYRAVLADEPYSATAEVIVPACVCIIPKASFLRMLEEFPKLAFRLMAKLAQTLRSSEEHLLMLAQKSVRQRTAHLLLLLMNKSSEKTPGRTRIDLPIRRSEMAQMIGTSPETFSRTLRTFANRGILRATRTEISIINPSALRRIAGLDLGPVPS